MKNAQAGLRMSRILRILALRKWPSSRHSPARADHSDRSHLHALLPLAGERSEPDGPARLRQTACVASKQITRERSRATTPRRRGLRSEVRSEASLRGDAVEAYQRANFAQRSDGSGFGSWPRRWRKKRRPSARQRSSPTSAEDESRRVNGVAVCAPNAGRSQKLATNSMHTPSTIPTQSKRRRKRKFGP